jgi:hypothetical protein
MTTTDQSLGYATPPKAQRFSLRARRATVLALIIALGVTCYQTRHWWERKYTHCRLIYWQNRALEETAAVDAVALQVKPGSAMVQNGSDVGYRFLFEMLGAFRWAPSAGKPTVIFAHRISNPSGEQRLVLVEAVPSLSPHVAGWPLRAYVFEVGSYFGSPPKELHSVANLYFIDLLRVSGEPVTCFRGQADPNKASRFTIRLDVNGLERSIECWLTSNDAVLFQHEGGPGWLERQQSWLPNQPTAPTTRYIPKKPGSGFGL